MPASILRAATCLAVAVALGVSCPLAAFAASGNDGNSKWVATWSTAPVNTWKGSTAPALVNFAFPFTAPALPQAQNQTVRMILKPDLWGDTMRVRLSNTWGPQAVTFGKVAIGLQSFSGATVAGTNRVLTFSGRTSVTVAAGALVWSDPVQLDWTHGVDGDGPDQVSPVLEGRNLAISMYIPGSSGPMTYHGTALQESFLGAPNSGDHAEDDSDAAFPFETSSWFFVNAVDVMAPADTRVLVGAGSSSVDGSITTPDQNDRFLNWMSRRLHAAYGRHVSVVNEVIGGDTAAIPNQPGQRRPLLQVLPERFSRDILGVSGVTDVLFYAGTNDIGDGIPPAQSIASLQSMVATLHSKGINAIGATLISNVGQAGTTEATYQAHNAINDFIRAAGNFDSVCDFFNVTADPSNTDSFGNPILYPQFATHSDPNGTPDFLHVGRAGAQAEGNTLDIGFFAPGQEPRR
ncbi:MAG TPA: GDSL-type esterase/lipase family protein [Burkholderiaceae bacterium]|nr:GDSL-type esterase/lipase family protein [Burkholderiaceae bacterium]